MSRYILKGELKGNFIGLDCKELKYWEIYNEKTGNKEDKYLINFYLYDLDKECRVAENEFWITMSQAKEEDRRLI